MNRGIVLLALLALAILAGRPGAAHGQGRATAGVFTGYDADYDALLTGLTARVRPAAVSPFTFSANLEYIPPTSRVAQDAQARLVELGLDGLVPIAQSGPFSVWGGGGPSLRYVHVKTKRDSSDAIVVEGGGDLRIGFSGVGEARLHLAGPLRAFAQINLTLGTPLRTRFSGGLLLSFPL